jgi:hypothetical protein
MEVADRRHGRAICANRSRMWGDGLNGLVPVDRDPTSQARAGRTALAARTLVSAVSVLVIDCDNRASPPMTTPPT